MPVEKKSVETDLSFVLIVMMPLGSKYCSCPGGDTCKKGDKHAPMQCGARVTAGLRGHRECGPCRGEQHGGDRGGRDEPDFAGGTCVRDACISGDRAGILKILAKV